MLQVESLLNQAWKAAAHHTQMLTVDEASIPFRGQARNKVRNPAKPKKNHIKWFVLAAADGPLRGYVFGIDTYGGKGDGGENEDGAKVDYVTRLLEDCLDGKGHVVFCDNYYGSEKLMRTLNDRGIHCCCTFNPNSFRRARSSTLTRSK